MEKPMLVSTEALPTPRWPLVAVVLALAVAVIAGFLLLQSRGEIEEGRRRIAELEAQVKAQEQLAPALAPEQKQPVLENLKPLLKVDNEEVRARAVELTALVAPKESDLLLDQVLRADPSPRVKLAALDVVGKQKIVYCRGEMLGLLKSEDGAVRRKAAWALGALGKGTDEEAMKKTRSEIFEALRNENDRWAATLAVKTSEVKSGKKGGEAAPVVPPGQAFGLLAPYVQALGEIGDAESAAKLNFLLDNLDPLVRRETVVTLGKIGAPESQKALVHKYRTESEAMVQNAIVTALTETSFRMKFDAKTKQFTDSQ